MFESILSCIRAHDTIILHRHSQCDGDAMGSQLGLWHILKENFPEKAVYMVGDDPGFFSFLGEEGSKTPLIDELPDRLYSEALVILLDCGSPALISDTRYTTAKTVARIDHHIFCGAIGDPEVIDSSFESCCGMITAMALEQSLTIPKEAALALYAGMVTDSGRFRYDSVNGRTFRLAAALLEVGVDTGALFRTLYADDFEKRKQKALFTLKIRFTENRVAYVYNTREEVQALGMSEFSVSRGMVNTMADIRGTDIWVNFTESDRGVLCEIRSAEQNINPIAVKYGGGGHAKASGATVPDYETAMAMLADLDRMAGGTK